MKALLGEYAGKGYVMRRCKRAVEVIRYMGLFEKIVNDCRLKSCVLFEGDVLLSSGRSLAACFCYCCPLLGEGNCN
jgi:hypothetical protein